MRRNGTLSLVLHAKYSSRGGMKEGQVGHVKREHTWSIRDLLYGQALQAKYAVMKLKEEHAGC
jgi:hypothetical protein